MYYQKGDKLKWKKKTFTIKEVSGLYSSTGVVITLESGSEVEKMKYISEFLPLVDSGEIVELFNNEDRGLIRRKIA